LKLSIKTFDPWFVGCIGAAGVLTALVPGSMMLIAASTLVAKNIYREILPSTSERALTVVAKAATPIIAAISVYLTIKGGSSIVALLIMGYSIVTQLFPALVASLVPNSVVTRAGACAGIVAGVITVALVVSLKLDFSSILPGAPSSFKDINAGFIALAINLIVTFGVSFVGRPAPLAAPTA
jgi:solute:Na+ symporter, SSS family